MKENMMPSPEEIAKINKSRIISDGKLAEGGAEVDVDGKIIVTSKQVDDIRKEFENDDEKRADNGGYDRAVEEFSKLILDFMEQNQVQETDEILVEALNGTEWGYFGGLEDDKFILNGSSGHSVFKIGDVYSIKLIKKGNDGILNLPDFSRIRYSDLHE